MKRKLIIILSVFGILIVGFISMNMLAGMKKEEKKKPQVENKRHVKASPVKYSDIKTKVVASGRVTAEQYVEVIAEVQGKIIAGNVRLKKGQSFRKGDLLARIFNEEAQYNLKGRKSRFLTSIANLLADFKVDYPQSYPNWNSFFESIDIAKPLPDLPQAKSKQEKVFLATRNVLSDYYAIKSEEVRFNKYNIYAPFNGTFTDVMLEPGSVANPGSRIGKIISTDVLELEVPIDVTNSKWIKKGDKVQILSEDNETQWKGTLIRKSSFVDPQTQSFSAFVTIVPKTDQPIFKGQYLKAIFPGMEIKNCMEIPRKAVFNHNEVYIVEDSVLRKKEIKVHKLNEETLIFSGLNEGTKLVMESLVGATENMKVSILED